MQDILAILIVTAAGAYAIYRAVSFFRRAEKGDICGCSKGSCSNCSEADRDSCGK